MAAVMDLARAASSFPFPVEEEPSQLSDYGPLPFAGGGPEEEPPAVEAAFGVSDYVTFHEGSLEGYSPFAGTRDRNPVLPVAEGTADSSVAGQASNGMMDLGVLRIAFRTRSDVDVLDDGYKWRKYGKKSVKNSPNPRNYYRCAAAGCGMKKRVERDGEDPRFVITTYNGAHTHLPPGGIHKPAPRDWGSPCSWMDTLMAASGPWETP